MHSPHSGHRAGISSVSYSQEIAGQASNEEAVPKRLYTFPQIIALRYQHILAGRFVKIG